MEKQIEFVVDKGDVNLFFELLYMGYVMFEAKVEEYVEDTYGELVDNLFRQYISKTKNMPLEEISDNAVAALREKQIDATENYILNYDDTVYFTRLAERILNQYKLVGVKKNSPSYEDFQREVVHALRFVGEEIIVMRAPFMEKGFQNLRNAIMKKK